MNMSKWIGEPLHKKLDKGALCEVVVGRRCCAKVFVAAENENTYQHTLQVSFGEQVRLTWYTQDEDELPDTASEALVLEWVFGHLDGMEITELLNACCRTAADTALEKARTAFDVALQAVRGQQQ